MFRVDEYIQQLILSMKNVFGGRLLYVGLQGSYLRGEATENSDIDIMVIIENLSVQDLDSYKKIIMKMEHYKKSCGFICGIEEFSRWIRWNYATFYTAQKIINRHFLPYQAGIVVSA